MTNQAPQWAREHGEHYRATFQPDGRTRQTEVTDLYRYVSPADGVPAAVIPDGADIFRDATRAVYLLDDGRTVAPYYVAGWHPEHRYLMIHAFPTNYDENGQRRMRPDGRPVDMSTWTLPPLNTYHLKISKA